jgi:hypothetical protein
MKKTILKLFAISCCLIHSASYSQNSGATDRTRKLFQEIPEYRQLWNDSSIFFQKGNSPTLDQMTGIFSLIEKYERNIAKNKDSVEYEWANRVSLQNPQIVLSSQRLSRFFELALRDFSRFLDKINFLGSICHNNTFSICDLLQVAKWENWNRIVSLWDKVFMETRYFDTSLKNVLGTYKRPSNTPFKAITIGGTGRAEFLETIVHPQKTLNFDVLRKLTEEYKTLHKLNLNSQKNTTTDKRLALIEAFYESLLNHFVLDNLIELDSKEYTFGEFSKHKVNLVTKDWDRQPIEWLRQWSKKSIHKKDLLENFKLQLTKIEDLSLARSSMLRGESEYLDLSSWTISAPEEINVIKLRQFSQIQNSKINLVQAFRILGGRTLNPYAIFVSGLPSLDSLKSAEFEAHDSFSSLVSDYSEFSREVLIAGESLSNSAFARWISTGIHPVANFKPQFVQNSRLSLSEFLNEPLVRNWIHWKIDLFEKINQAIVVRMLTESTDPEIKGAANEKEILLEQLNSLSPALLNNSDFYATSSRTNVASIRNRIIELDLFLRKKAEDIKNRYTVNALDAASYFFDFKNQEELVDSERMYEIRELFTKKIPNYSGGSEILSALEALDKNFKMFNDYLDIDQNGILNDKDVFAYRILRPLIAITNDL